MPEWLSAFFGGVLLALAGQWLHAIFRGRQHRQEKLLDRYAEFVGAASAELDRVKSLEAGLALGAREGDHGELIKIEASRHESRRELSRIAFQIRILEKDEELTEKIIKLTKSQPFMPFAVPPQWGAGNYNERFEKFRAQISEFDTLLLDVANSVLKKHTLGPGRTSRKLTSFLIPTSFRVPLRQTR